jgi:hypothetical protein
MVGPIPTGVTPGAGMVASWDGPYPLTMKEMSVPTSPIRANLQVYREAISA